MLLVSLSPSRATVQVCWRQLLTWVKIGVWMTWRWSPCLACYWRLVGLTHWHWVGDGGMGVNLKMATVLQTTFSNAFSGIKIYWFRLKFYQSLFPRVQLTIFHHCLVYWRIYASLGLSELTLYVLNYFWGKIKIFFSFHIWDCKGSWNPSFGIQGTIYLTTLIPWLLMLRLLV